jgi:hypothetical protein
MRTTIRLDDQLFAELKKLAAEEGRPLAAVIEDALRESMARRRVQSDRASVRLPTFRGDGLMPGVDLDSNALMLDLIDKDASGAVTGGGAWSS